MPPCLPYRANAAAARSAASSSSSSSAALVRLRLRLCRAQAAAAPRRMSTPAGRELHGQELSHSMVVDFAIFAGGFGVVGEPACGGSSYLRRCRFGSDGWSSSSAEVGVLVCLFDLGEAAAVGQQDQKIESAVFLTATPVVSARRGDTSLGSAVTACSRKGDFAGRRCERVWWSVRSCMRPKQRPLSLAAIASTDKFACAACLAACGHTGTLRMREPYVPAVDSLEGGGSESAAAFEVSAGAGCSASEM